MAEFGYGSWDVTCPSCGKVRSIRAHRYKNGHIRGEENVCQSCKGKNLSKQVMVACPICGKERSLSPSDLQQRLTPYCQTCVKSKREHPMRYGRHTGTNSRGYVQVYGLHGHPLRRGHNAVLEHWLVLYESDPMGPDNVLWFWNNGFSLHHKNGVPSDNRLENLELRALGRHPKGWTLEEMREVLFHLEGRSGETADWSI